MNTAVKPLASGAIVELQDVGRTFLLGETRIEALRHATLAVMPGDFLAIWGPSGSGKSTLLNLLGLIDSPSYGRMLFRGEDVAGLDDNALSDYRSREIGFVFQNFNLIPVLSALENVMLPLHCQRAPKAEARARALAWLQKVGLAAFADHPPEKLSGGQRQRVAIARAMVTEPSLVIADEPTANLDSHTSREVIDLMQALNHKTGVTFVLSTHDPRLLARVSRHLALRDGEIAEASYEESMLKLNAESLT
ncbi:lipoprotein-releasing system ATP-binding protein LolD [Chromobacterium phragmitis]|uniref:ABC transporter ATP-binding protein n=3 Tax=Chromobacterium phragmitis TaxID=2202141 RepID=A0A344UKW3_9NEIS|nr:ABC transporter ATP-binding protein [Chromobacterium phragmitis]AXE30539.1 lipoprotein-releasing system ATP-binding protein LolD [Chromobacterium phragmitis]AXE35911.1 lipoprotein-releasing system ATP-binding protein LolD [Chromobacterium phragmitis]